MRSAPASSTVANTGIRLSRPLIRSIFRTGGRGAMRPKPHPAASAWLAIRTKALSPRASQKDRPVRSSSSSRTGRAMAAQPCSTAPSLVVRSSSAGILTISIPAPRAVAVWFSPWIIVVCHLSSIAVEVCGLRSHGGLPGCLGSKVLTGTGATSLLNGPRRPDTGCMKMRFPRRRAKTAGRSPGGQTAGTPPDDRADCSRWPALGDRACCCPARPAVRVLIPPGPGRPHSVDLLLCGHHYRMSCATLAAANAVIVNDERGGGTSVSEHAAGDATAADTRRR